MTIYYKGARIGSYWHNTDARLTGFYAVDPGGTASPDRMTNHISESNFTTPYISLTASYCVALAYALYGERFPDRRHPAFVYEIEISAQNGSNINVVDPVREITSRSPSPPAAVPYHHDGHQDFLIGVVSPNKHKMFRMRPKQYPPGSHPISEPANLSKHLRAIVFALRDAEILVYGAVPRTCIINRHEVTVEDL